MGGEAVPKRMTAGRFGNPGLANGQLDGVLQILLLEMVPPRLLRTRINREFRRGKDVLPGPGSFRVGIFPAQTEGKIDLSAAPSEVLLMQLFDALDMRV